MSTRVYLSKNLCQTTQEENTPVCIRIQASHATVKALQARLQDAYRRDEVRLVRRIRVRLELLTQTASVTVLCERWGLSPSCLYDWQKAFMLRGMDSLVSRHSGGRPEQLTPRQQKRLVELIEAGPRVVGFETACWARGLDPRAELARVWRPLHSPGCLHVAPQHGVFVPKGPFGVGSSGRGQAPGVAAGHMAGDGAGGQALQRDDPVCR